MTRDSLRGARAPAFLPSRRITRSKRTPPQRKTSQASGREPRAKRPRISNGAAVSTRRYCVSCGNSKGELAKCATCKGLYHIRCVGSSGKGVPGPGWVCGVCNLPEELTRAVAIAPGPCAPASQPMSETKSHSAVLVQSMLARLSGTSISTSDQRLYSGLKNSVDDPLIAHTKLPFDHQEKGADSNSVTDAVLAWTLKRVGGEGGTGNTLPREPLKQRSSKESDQESVQRRSGGMRRAISGVGDSNCLLVFGSIGPRCYCGNTDVTKATARCVSCAAVFHPSCMDPPYPTVKSLPVGGYTCLACRPTCGVCDMGISPELPASLKIACAGCKHVFHRACLTPLVTGQCEEWECLECSLALEDRDDNNDALPVETREPSAPHAGSMINRDVSRSKTDEQQGLSSTARTVATSRVVGKANRRQRACVVCGVAEGKRMNVCGSCGDAYHSLCLDRPRTRRAGDSWRCDSCRPPALIDAPTLSVVPPSLPGALPDPVAGGVALIDLHTEPTVTRPCAPGTENTGRWTKDEHTRFLEGIKKYQNRWQLVSDLVGTRTPTQCRTHAQKYTIKLNVRFLFGQSRDAARSEFERR